METSNNRTSLWNGLDRRVFCENAIILDVMGRTQGNRIESHIGSGLPDDLSVEATLHAFLNDIALIAAGPGGKDNVASAVLEREADKPGMTIRVARNNGFGVENSEAIQSLLETVKYHPDSQAADLDTEHDRALQLIVSRCHTRVQKHVSALSGEITNAGCRPVGSCRDPYYDANRKITVSNADSTSLGPYTQDNHRLHANLLMSRMNELRSLIAQANTDKIKSTNRMCCIVKLSYDLSRSELLHLWLAENICATVKPTSLKRMADDIVKRIAKLSKFQRAALTVVKFMRQMMKENVRVKVSGLNTNRIPVPELASSTAASMKARTGTLLRKSHKSEAARMLGLWDRYRTHAEMQLLIFYEENEHIQLVTNFIGGNKLCCYLCYHFMTKHGRFLPNGCHQALYSLWMLPERSENLSLAASSRLHGALSELHHLLQWQVSDVSRASALKKIYHAQRESCDNLSRNTICTIPDLSRFGLRPTGQQKRHKVEVLSIQEEVSTADTTETWVQSRLDTIPSIGEEQGLQYSTILESDQTLDQQVTSPSISKETHPQYGFVEVANSKHRDHKYPKRRKRPPHRRRHRVRRSGRSTRHRTSGRDYTKSSRQRASHTFWEGFRMFCRRLLCL